MLQGSRHALPLALKDLFCKRFDATLHAQCRVKNDKGQTSLCRRSTDRHLLLLLVSLVECALNLVLEMLQQQGQKPAAQLLLYFSESHTGCKSSAGSCRLDRAGQRNACIKKVEQIVFSVQRPGAATQFQSPATLTPPKLAVVRADKAGTGSIGVCRENIVVHRDLPRCFHCLLNRGQQHLANRHKNPFR